MTNSPDLSKTPMWVRLPGGVAFEDIPIRPPGPIPSFFIIGASKTGTTSLFNYLRRHPQIHMCFLKEPHFFSTDEIYSRGIEWYRGLFSDAMPNQLCGDASTSYSFAGYSRQAALRISQVAPNAKIIYLIREPVARVESECLQILKYRHFVLRDTTTQTLDGILDELQSHQGREEIKPVGNSQYIEHLREYVDVFGKDRVLVLRQSELRTDARAALDKVCMFLGVERGRIPESLSEHANVTEKFVSIVRAEQLSQRLRKMPGALILRQYLPTRLRTAGRNVLLDSMRESNSNVLLSVPMREKLQRHFVPYNKELEVFLRQDLKSW